MASTSAPDGGIPAPARSARSVQPGQPERAGAGRRAGLKLVCPAPRPRHGEAIPSRSSLWRALRGLALASTGVPVLAGCGGGLDEGDSGGGDAWLRTHSSRGRRLPPISMDAGAPSARSPPGRWGERPVGWLNRPPGTRQRNDGSSVHRVRGACPFRSDALIRQAEGAWSATMGPVERTGGPRNGALVETAALRTAGHSRDVRPGIPLTLPRAP